MVQIPIDPLSGLENLELGCPWITPESCPMLESLVKRTDNVLEFGCGGSTVFFAHLAASVTSFESNRKWANQVRDALDERVDNDLVTINLYRDKYDLGRQLKYVSVSSHVYDVILVDQAWAVVNRDWVLSLLCHHDFKPRVLVLDNYASPKGNPISWNFSREQFAAHFPILKDHLVHTYDYQGWGGRGTRIYWKEEKSAD